MDTETSSDARDVSPLALISLEADLAQRLEDCYAHAEFLENASTAIHEHLQNECYASSTNSRDESEIPSDAENINDDTNYDQHYNQHYYEDDIVVNGDENEVEDCDDYHGKEYDDEDGAYENWEGDDEYYA